jgi:hypothetical protein
VAVVQFCVDHLTVEEQNSLRAGWGQEPVGFPLEDWCLDGYVDRPVPTALRPRVGSDRATTPGT